MRPILIVEDEPSIAILIQYNLEKAGYETEIVSDGEAAVIKVLNNKYGMIILDVMLPKMDGMEACKQIREHNKQIPILMLTAKTEESDKIYGLEIGADDYITKPFSPKELIARMKAVLRRTKQEKVEDATINIGDIEISPKRYRAYFKGVLLELTRKEFELLVYLAEHVGEILSREQLLSAVWNYDFVGDTRIVDVHISHLRDKIETDKKNPQYIKTVRGFGYKLEEQT